MVVVKNREKNEMPKFIIKETLIVKGGVVVGVLAGSLTIEEVKEE